jgi:tetratricopeptide (TPR) repeat protein
MKQIPIFLILFLLCWLPFGFAQTPGAVAEKQDPLKDSVDKYEKIYLWAKVLAFAEQWEAKLKKEKRENTADYGRALGSLGHALNRNGKSQEAEPILLQSLEILKKGLGESHQDVAQLLNYLGNSYSDMVNYPKAEPYYLKALEIFIKESGENHEEVGTCYNYLGNLYSNMGNYPKTELYYLKALKIFRVTLGEAHINVGVLYNNLGGLYMIMGDYPKAEPYCLKALEIFRVTLGEAHINVGTSYIYLASLYRSMGNYPKAEPYYLKALEIFIKALGENHEEVGTCYNNLGSFYREMGNYPKAEPFYLKGLEIFRVTLGEAHINVGTSYRNLGGLYMNMGNYSKAEPYCLRALEIFRKALGEDHPNVAASYFNFGSLYSGMCNYSKAEQYHLKALEIFRRAFGEDHPNVAILYISFGVLYSDMGNYSKAEPYLLKALEINKRALGKDHPDVTDLICSFGDLYFSQGQMEKAEINYLDWNAKKQTQVQRYFPFLSENEKKEFYENKLSASQEIYKSFCVNRYAGKKAIAENLYNDQLATKGLLLNNSAKWKHRIKIAGDKKLSRLFDEWEINQNKLNKLFQSSDSTELAGLDSLKAKTEKMEKELSLRSENFAKLADKKLINWKDVQKALKPGEAAVEIVRVKKFGIEKTVTDTSDPKKPVYQVKGLTDTIYYAALIVKPGSIIPEMVVLKNGNDMEGKYLKYYQNLIKNKLDDNKSYQQFWQKIGARLEGSKRVFFSPDGVYHNLNLNTLFNPKTKKFLLEEKDIRIVTVTKDIVNPSLVEEDNKLAELVGFPSYYTNQTGQIAAITERKSPELIYGLSLKSTGSLAELPATKTEVDKIADILTEKGWEVKNYTGSTALEENIKESYKPRLLHVATHGFFQPDTTKGSNPLLRSGLMLAGAGNTLKGEKNETGEDGILTAYEAMNLNLDNTDLVVLSACETGLGEIKNGEGVYGLQRAFKVAGAKSIIHEFMEGGRCGYPGIDGGVL